jgi:NADPH-dependent 2,4-dienoyl-CoA reductase/sulfur reductase-like enzyme
VVGGGPAGLEAARVSAERGHNVVLLEASNKLGGQIQIAARVSWRHDLISIVEWRKSELKHLGVDVRQNLYATPEDIIELKPDVVILATGGIPDIDWVDGAEHCVSVWDVINNQTRHFTDVIVYDGNGYHQALSCAEHLARLDKKVTLITPDIMLGQDVSGKERALYLKHFYEFGIDIIYDHRLLNVKSNQKRLNATFINEYTGKLMKRKTGKVVVEHGTIPDTELYDELKCLSSNSGVMNIDAFISGKRQPKNNNLEKKFELYCIGDAVTSRNIHMAIYDAFRLCSVL